MLVFLIKKSYNLWLMSYNYKIIVIDDIQLILCLEIYELNKRNMLYIDFI